jgi:hypothetical protein
MADTMAGGHVWDWLWCVCFALAVQERLAQTCCHGYRDGKLGETCPYCDLGQST